MVRLNIPPRYSTWVLMPGESCGFGLRCRLTKYQSKDIYPQQTQQAERVPHWSSRSTIRRGSYRVFCAPRKQLCLTLNGACKHLAWRDCAICAKLQTLCSRSGGINVAIFLYIRCRLIFEHPEGIPPRNPRPHHALCLCRKLSCRRFYCGCCA